MRVDVICDEGIWGLVRFGESCDGVIGAFVCVEGGVDVADFLGQFKIRPFVYGIFVIVILYTKR